MFFDNQDTKFYERWGPFTAVEVPDSSNSAPAHVGPVQQLSFSRQALLWITRYSSSKARGSPAADSAVTTCR